MQSQHLKERLIEAIEGLPEDRLREVLDFVEYLQFKGHTQTPHDSQGLDPQDDPLLSFIGGVSHGNLAHGIDEEIYGH